MKEQCNICHTELVKTSTGEWLRCNNENCPIFLATGMCYTKPANEHTKRTPLNED